MMPVHGATRERHDFGPGPILCSSEKDVFESTSSATSLPSEDSKNDWDWSIERKARRKVDFSVLLLLFLGFLIFQIDRMNLASALTAGFAEDLDIDQDTVNLGNQLLYMGIVVLEIPCNMALQKVGPRKWMSLQVLLFGFTAMTQIFLTNKTGFLLSRLALGVSEAGYIPGAIYTLSTWYVRKELAKRLAVFFFGMFGGNAISPLLASGILKMEGLAGFKGWQWMFLLEGLFTICIAVAFFFLLPGCPDDPRPLIGPGVVRFSTKEQEVLVSRLDADGEGKRLSAQGMTIDLKLVWKTITHYQRWPHYLSTFAVFSTWTPLTTYTPSIIMDLGFDRIEANALAAVGASLALAVVFIAAYFSDRTNQRGAAVIAAQACYLVVLVVARQTHPHVGKWSRWGLWTAVNAFAVGYHPVHNTWLQLNCRQAGERSIAIAIWVMSAISGMMVATQYFRAEDRPFYQDGLRTMIIMVSVGIAAAVVQMMIYAVHNKKVKEGGYDGKCDQRPMVYTL